MLHGCHGEEDHWLWLVPDKLGTAFLHKVGHRFWGTGGLLCLAHLTLEELRQREIRILSSEATAVLRTTTGAQFETRFHGWHKWMFRA